MTLKAGSYLKLLSDPQMDLMDVIEETAPVLKVKERYHQALNTVTLSRQALGSDEWDSRSYEIPIGGVAERIAYENVHGERSGNCDQLSESFTVKPSPTAALRSMPPGYAVIAHDGMATGGTLHRIDQNKTKFVTGQNQAGGPIGLAAWDHSVYNELWPGYPGWPVDLINHDSDPLSVDDELVRAFDIIRPAVNSSTSLLVTLAELKDVKSLFSEPMAFANSVLHRIGRKQARKWTIAQVLRDPELLLSISKSLAKGHLYREFGLKQTVRDVTAMFSTFLSLDTTVREILSQTGSHVRHYSIPLYQQEESYERDDYQDLNWIISRKWRSTLTRKFVVTVRYTAELVDALGQPISPNDPELVRLGAALDTLGVNMNPAILWDVVPFSFVVDYFVGIGNWLERFKRNNLNFTIGVQDACYSVKREIWTGGTTDRWTSSWDGLSRNPDNPLQERENYVGGVEFNHFQKTYQRIRFVPNGRMLAGEGDISFATPSNGQWTILASLITANVPKRGRRG